MRKEVLFVVKCGLANRYRTQLESKNFYIFFYFEAVKMNKPQAKNIEVIVQFDHALAEKVEEFYTYYGKEILGAAALRKEYRAPRSNKFTDTYRTLVPRASLEKRTIGEIVEEALEGAKISDTVKEWNNYLLRHGVFLVLDEETLEKIRQEAYSLSDAVNRGKLYQRDDKIANVGKGGKIYIIVCPDPNDVHNKILAGFAFLAERARSKDIAEMLRSRAKTGDILSQTADAYERSKKRM